MHLASPATFEIPTEERKQALRIGDDVKVGIRKPAPETISPEERIWVKLTEIKDGSFTATILSFPMFAEELGLRHRDVLSFESRHILDIVTVKQQIEELVQSLAKLKPFGELIELPDGDEDEIEIDDNKFQRLLLGTVPEHLIVHLVGDDLPEVEFSRNGEQIELRVREYHDPAHWEHTYTALMFCEAMLKIIEGLIADGHPLSSPELHNTDLVGTFWVMTFPLTTRPDHILLEIKDCCNRVRSGAKDLLA